MINKITVILSIQLIVGLWFLALSLSLVQAADVTLTVGDGSGSPGSSGNAVGVSLDNSVKVKGIQVEVCDVDNYLACTGCDTTGRGTSFECLTNELDNDCCRVTFFPGSGDLIEEGTGAIFTIKYDISSSAPGGECRELNPEEVSISDESGDPLPPLDIISEKGEFCFSDSGTTSTTTSLTTTTTTISHSYKVSISPLSATIKSGASLQFSAKTTYAGEEVEGTYSWEITSDGSIESSIDGNGLFTAGDNDTIFDIKEKVKVTDTKYENKSATATITIKVKEDPHTECEVAISPLAATVSPGEMLTLIATATGDCKTPQYEWSLLDSDTDSSIESQGDTCIYTAGANDGTEPLTDIITVTDTVNEVDAEAKITIRAEGGSIRVLDDPLWKSHWIPLPYLMVIKGEGTHFEIFNSTLAFEPSEAAVSLLSLVLSDLYIWDIILVMPSWLAGGEDQTVTVTVTTGDEVVSDDFTISLLPLILDQERSLR